MVYRSRKTGRRRRAGTGRRRTVTVDLDEASLRAAVRAAKERMRVSSHKEAGKLAMRIRNTATRYTPVDTGLLKAGWTVTEIRWTAKRAWKVFNPISYAAEIEWGTRHMAAQPMLRPAIAEAVGVEVGMETRDWKALQRQENRS